MEMVTGLWNLFFSMVETVIAGAPWLLYLLLAAFLAALVFNFIDAISAG